MDIHPIKSEADYRAALAEIEHLFAAELDTPDGERLDLLTTLAEAYEGHRHPIAVPDPIEAIVYHLESRGLTRRDLEPYVGSRARVSEVLNRKRPLTLERPHPAVSDAGSSLNAALESQGTAAAEHAHAVDAATRPQDRSSFETWYRPNRFPIYPWRRG